MKKTTILALLLPSFAFAKEPPMPLPPATIPDGLSTFQTFGAIPLPEFLRIAFADLSGFSYVLAPDVLSMNLQLSADLTSQKSKIKDNVQFLKQVLEPLGIEVREIQPKVFFILKKIEKPEEKKEKRSTKRGGHRSFGLSSEKPRSRLLVELFFHFSISSVFILSNSRSSCFCTSFGSST